jgi:large subunit ribosomal protein L25
VTSFQQQSRGLFGQTFEVGQITAIRRDGVGSFKAQAARQKGLIPGIVYGYDEEGNDKVELVYVREADLRKEVNKRKDCFYNTLYDITIEGTDKKIRVLPRDFQIHPFRPKAISINWLRYRPGAYPGAKLEIPLKTFNEERSPGLKEGGWLLELIHKMPVYASGDSIPDYLMMDLRGMKAGDKIMASQVELNDGLILVS